MDDFYTEMRPMLEDIETSNFKPETIHQEYNFLQKYFPNMFAEGLVPFNPRRWPAFITGSSLSSDMPELGDKIRTPLENIRVAQEYLETSQSDVQYRDRFWQLTQDTMTINFSCELGEDPGSFEAGAISNKMADKYMDEIIETYATLNSRELLNDDIFKLVAKEKRLNPENVRGTGVVRQFVPDFMQGDLCDRPERNARPFDDDSSMGPLEDGIICNSNQNDPSPLGGSVFESSVPLVENQKSFFSHFFGLFGGLSEGNVCPANASEYNYSHPPFMDKLFDICDFFIPEGGGGGGEYCPDPSMLVPPSPFMGDCGDFCSEIIYF